MKLALIVGIYKRHDLEKIVIDRFKEQRKKFGFEIIVVGSEGEASRSLASDCHYIEYPNDSISTKYQQAVKAAQRLNCDGIVIMGSDNIVNDEYWKWIYTFKPDEPKAIGLKDIYFYCTLTERFAYWPGYRNRKGTAGAGRFYSKAVLDKLNWQIWDEGINKGMDSNANKRLGAVGVEDGIYSEEETGAFLLDVKHSFSITNRVIVSNCEQKNIREMAKKVGKPTAKKVTELPKPQVKDAKSYTQSTDEVKFECTKAWKGLKIGQVYDVSLNTAEVLESKGLGKIVK